MKRLTNLAFQFEIVTHDQSKSGNKSEGFIAPFDALAMSIALSGDNPRFFHCVAAIGCKPIALAIAARLPK